MRLKMQYNYISHYRDNFRSKWPYINYNRKFFHFSFRSVKWCDNFINKNDNFPWTKTIKWEGIARAKQDKEQ